MISREFLTAGQAIFTVDNGKGLHYTYRVEKATERAQPKPNLPPTWFVSLLTGPNNTNDYSYIGVLRNEQFVLTSKSRLPKDATAIKVITWAIGIIYGRNKLPEGYSIRHEGRCGKCGRPLTTPESIESGIGPVCAGRE